LKTGLKRLITNLFPIVECFQSNKIVSNVLILFPIYFLCFQSKLFVSNLKRLLQCPFFVPNVLFCFQSKTIVSNLFLSFHSNLFPIYVSNLYITSLTIYKCQLYLFLLIKIKPYIIFYFEYKLNCMQKFLNS